MANDELVLTPEQEAMLPAIRDKWMEIGLSTEPANRPEAEEGIRMAYARGDLEMPEKIFWANSPHEGALMQTLVRHFPLEVLSSGIFTKGRYARLISFLVDTLPQNPSRNNIIDACNVFYDAEGITALVRDEDYDEVNDTIASSILSFTDSNVPPSKINYFEVYDNLYNQDRGVDPVEYNDADYPEHAPLINALFEHTWNVISVSLVKVLTDWWRGLIGGNLWAGYYAWRWAYHDLGYPEICEQIDGLVKVAQNACWWWPLDRCTIVTERPSILHRDQLNRLHAETGNAIEWVSGWGFPVWHGVRLPAYPEEIMNWTPEQVFAEDNTEVRRSAIEIIGWERFIDQANFTLVDECEDPGNPGNMLSLYDAGSRIFDEPVRVLLCTNGSPERDGTRRRFGLTVPSTVNTAMGAAAWGYDLTEEQYASVQRRT